MTVALAIGLLRPTIVLAREHTAGGLIVDAPAAKTINYEKLTQEAVALLQQYVRLNTTNPPGNELAAAKMLRQKFLAEGIPATVWEPAPGRGIVAARLRGTGRHTKALVLLSHMDVVPGESQGMAGAAVLGANPRRRNLGARHARRQGPGRYRVDGDGRAKACGLFAQPRRNLSSRPATRRRAARSARAGWSITSPTSLPTPVICSTRAAAS